MNNFTAPDPGLEAAIREALRKPDGDITTADLAGLTELDAHGRGIVSLIGIEYCINLKWLDLWGNQISDITLLAGLTNLKRLYLNCNQISDLTPLVANPGLGKGARVHLMYNKLNLMKGSKALEAIRALRARGVVVLP